MSSAMKRSMMTILLLTGMLLTAAQAETAIEAGKALAAVGAVSATQPDGQARALITGGAVFRGDLVATGPGASVQLRYTDGTLVSLTGDSRLRIDDYVYPVPERGFYSLLKGGLRTLSGLIGKVRHDDYRMTTPIATIGIRGTDYQLRLCQDDCPAGFPNGLYLSVFEGSIVAVTDAGEYTLHAGESAFIPDRRAPLERRYQDPDLLIAEPPWHGARGRIDWQGRDDFVRGTVLEFHATDLIRCIP